jgi:dipeptidyl aminopeptidase/acylaminoacyl peptidase
MKQDICKKPAVFLCSMILFIAACIPTTLATKMPQEEATQTVEIPTSTLAVPSTATLRPVTDTAAASEPTASPETPSTTDVPLGSPLIAMIDEDTSGRRLIVLVDISTGTTRQLHLEDEPTSSLYWSQDGCEIIANLTNGKMVRIDLHGNILQVLFDSSLYLGDGPILASDSVLSPMEDWVAYPVGSGRMLYDRYESQDIYVVAVGDLGGPYRLTKHGGAREVDWSPDGRHLAYSDYDAAGVHQIYISRPDGQGRIQLTHFTDSEAELGRLRWSPDGRRIAVDYSGSLLLISLESERSSVMPIEAVGVVSTFWWHSDSIIAAFARGASAPEGPEDMAIYWIDATDGGILDHLTESETPGEHISMPKPLETPQRIGFFSETAADGFYVYDVPTRTCERQPDFERWFVWYWSAAPEAFVGETMCPH